MNKRTTISLALVIFVAAAALFALAPRANGGPSAQDATQIQGTIDALVQQRFQQTQAAMGPFLTATAIIQQATQAADALTATANTALGFQATVDAAFAQALTATAQAGQPVAATAQTQDIVGVTVVFEPKGDPSGDELRRTSRILNNRLRAMDLDGAGVNTDEDRKTITVTLPAVSNPGDIIAALQQTGRLTFVDFTDLSDQRDTFVGQIIRASGDQDNISDADAAIALVNPLENRPFQTVVGSDHIEEAEAVPSATGDTWDVKIEFDDRGAEIMSKYTQSHMGEPLAVVLDGRVLTVPVVQAEIGKEGLISANFTKAEAEALALLLKNGTLPTPLTVERTTIIAADGSQQVVVAPTGTPGPSPTPDLRPTPTLGEIQMAEEVFEHGRMFWVSPTEQIWVMVTTGEGRGTWAVFDDTFTDGEPEVDPSLVPPEGMYQPERGFGKLWRENQQVHDQLGWATTPEFGYESDYRYYPGGSIQNGQFVPGPGFHVLFTLRGEAIRFNEGDMTWELFTEANAD